MGQHSFLEVVTKDLNEICDYIAAQNQFIRLDSESILFEWFINL